MSTTATVTMRDYLAALALDALDASEAEALKLALERDDSLREQHAALIETASALAEAAPPAEAASLASVRARLFDAPSSALAPGLFERFGARFAAIFDVTLERAKELLGLVDDPLGGHLLPGAEPMCDGATEHDFVAAGDEAYLFAVRVWGVDFSVPRPSS